MSLLDEILELNAKKPGKRRCDVKEIIKVLSVEDAQGLEAAIADNSIPARVIALALSYRGYTVTHQAVQAHRRGDC